MKEPRWTRGEVRWLRGGLVVLALTPAVIAAWGLAAPHSFYRSFPGAGRSWVAPLGPYDEHLVRDVAALDLGMLVLLVVSAALLERTLVIVALVSYAAASVPHLAYHLTTLGRFSPGDNAASIAGLALQVALPLALVYVAARPRARARPVMT